MENFNTNCPHCGVVLEVQQAWIGMDVSCPECGSSFTIQAPTSSPDAEKNGTSVLKEKCIGISDKLKQKLQKKSSNTATADNTTPPKSQYPWGRLYIAIARFIAILTLIAAIYAICDTFNKAFTARRDLLENLSGKSAAVNEKQQAFQQHFNDLAEIVLTGNHSPAKFKFPTDLPATQNSFNESLMTLEEWQESDDTAKEYMAKLQTITNVMERYFESSAGKIDRKLRQGDSLKFKEIKGQKKNTSLSMRMKKDIDFYSLTPDELREIISYTRENIKRLSGSEAVKDVKNEFQSLEKGLDFIDLTLCAKEKNMHIRGKKTEESIQNRSIGQDRYAWEKEILTLIRQNLNILYTYDKAYNNHFIWQLTAELAELQSALEKHQIHIIQTRAKIKDIFTSAFKLSACILILALFVSFLIMVFADYLQAHFDSSDTLRKIYTKGITLLILLLLTGCGSSVENELENQKAELQKAAIENIFAQIVQDEDNVGAVLYGKKGEEIILIKEGGKQHSQTEKYTEILKFYRAYNAMRLKIQYNADAVKFNPIKKISRTPYTHKTNMTITCKRMTTAQADIPGLTVHALKPNDFSDWSEEQQEKWIRSIYERMPSGLCDHAIALARMEYQDTETYVQNLELFFNSTTNRWEIKSDTTRSSLQERAEAPKRNLQQEKHLLQESGFREITLTVTDPQLPLVLQKKDYEVIEKLNKGLVLVDGQWKDKIVHEQNMAVLAVMSQLINDKSWDAIEKFTSTINVSPKAENLNEAYNRLENVLQEKLGKNSKNKTELQHILEKLEHPSLAVLPADTKEKLVQKCREQIQKLDEETAARNAANRAARREKLTQSREMLEKIKSSISEDFNTIESLGRQSGFFDDEKNLQQYQKLTILTGLNQNNQRVISDLIRDQWKFDNYDFRIVCQSCDGKGKKKCGYCNNSGICQKCNGSGQRKTVDSVYSGGRFHTSERIVSCSPKCTYCGGQPHNCKRCRGITGFLNRKLVKTALAKETSRFLEMVDAFMKEIDQEYEKVKD